MPQGKLKVKAKMPSTVKKKINAKPPAVRKNKPIAPKKGKFEEVEKLKKIMTKNVNETFESELRSVATGRPNASMKKGKVVTAEANKMPPKTKKPT